MAKNMNNVWAKSLINKVGAEEAKALIDALIADMEGVEPTPAKATKKAKSVSRKVKTTRQPTPVNEDGEFMSIDQFLANLTGEPEAKKAPPKAQPKARKNSKTQELIDLAAIFGEDVEVEAPAPKEKAQPKEKAPNPRILTERPAMKDLCFAQVSWSAEGGIVEWKDRMPGSRSRRTYKEVFTPEQRNEFAKAVVLVNSTLPMHGAVQNKTRAKDDMPYTIQKHWNPNK